MQKTVRILTTHRSTPDSKDARTMFIQSMYENLKKEFNVKIFWVVYSPKNSQYSASNPDFQVLYYDDFNSASEI